MGDLLDSMLDLMRSVCLPLFQFYPNLSVCDPSGPSSDSINHNIICRNIRKYCDEPVVRRRLPPTKIEANLNALLDLCPEYADDLLGSVDQPLKILTDKSNGRDYLACDYNRDGDSYR